MRAIIRSTTNTVFSAGAIFVFLAVFIFSAALANGDGRQFAWKDGVVQFHILRVETDNNRIPPADQPTDRDCYRTMPNPDGRCKNAEEIAREALARVAFTTPIEFRERNTRCPSPQNGERDKYTCLEIVVAVDDEGVATGAFANPRELNVGATGPGVAVHELGHALGFRHEFARADARSHINIHDDCAAAIANNNDNPEGTTAEHRRLYGPAQFGGFLAGNSDDSTRLMPFRPASSGSMNDVDRQLPSLMAYSTHKAQSPMQACFKRCVEKNGDGGLTNTPATPVNGVCDNDDMGEAAVDRPWDTPGVVDDRWRNWSCTAEYGASFSKPANVRGCGRDGEEDVLANCQLCRGSTKRGKANNKLAMAFEKKTTSDDERVYFSEHRKHFTFLDRAKIARRYQRVDLDDVVVFDDNAFDGRLFAVGDQNRNASASNSGRNLTDARAMVRAARAAAVSTLRATRERKPPRDGAKPARATDLRKPPQPPGASTQFAPSPTKPNIVRIGHFNNDFYSDILNYNPLSGSLRLRVTTRKPGVQEIKINGAMPLGYDIVEIGWFERGTRPNQPDYFDAEQDIFAYDSKTGDMEFGRLEYSPSIDKWSYERTCKQKIPAGYKTAVVGNFHSNAWWSSIALIAHMDGDVASVDVWAPRRSSCITKTDERFAAGGPWTHVTRIDRKLFGCDSVNAADKTKCDNPKGDMLGDQMTDLFFYNADTGKGNVFEREPGSAVKFRMIPSVPAANPPLPSPFPKGASAVAEADINDDTRGDLIFFNEQEQTIQRVLGAGVSYAPGAKTSVAKANVDWTQMFVGQFPDGRRPASEATCGNAIREGDEECDMGKSFAANICPVGKAPTSCTLDCRAVCN